jgi:hypothetical protein
MIEAFAPSLYVADGPRLSFLGFDFSTRMAIVRLEDGGLWVWSPVALDDELARGVDALGPVRCLVTPNKLHHLFLRDWMTRWPEARVHAPPGLARKRRDLHFDAELGDEPDPAWAAEIDQTNFRGSFFMDEIVFFHRVSRTAIVGDLVQRHDPSGMSRLREAIMRLDGLVGEDGSTPRDWRVSFWRRAPARAARATVLGWKPERLVIAHGACAKEGASALLERALVWI